MPNVRALSEHYGRRRWRTRRTVTSNSRRNCATIAGYRAVQPIHGVGPVLAAIFVAEIGDVTRFARPQQLCSWAGLTPRHRECDAKVRR